MGQLTLGTDGSQKGPRLLLVPRPVLCGKVTVVTDQLSVAMADILYTQTAVLLHCMSPVNRYL